jgi:zinc transporter ZupT
MQLQFLTRLIGSSLCLIVLQSQSHLTIELWSNQILIPIIAGLFVYISTVHIIPEVIENNFGLKGTILKVSTCTISVFIIFYLKKYE